VLGIEVVGLFVGARVVGDPVGFLVGLFVVGLEVGVLVGFRVVGLAVVGLRVGPPVGWYVGVGFLVVGRVVGGAVVGLEVHPTISVGGMHTLLTVSQLFWVQTMPSLQPESLMECSSASEFCAKHYLQGMSYYWWLQWPNNTHPQGT